MALNPFPMPPTTTLRKEGTAPPVSAWSLHTYAVRYRGSSRKVTVLAPFREHAGFGVGASSDEDVQQQAIDALSASVNKATLAKKPKGNELERFFSEMERCMRTGLSETQSLKLVVPLARSPYFRGVLSGLHYLMSKMGVPMSDAMVSFPEAFDAVTVEMKRAGETGGKQAEVYGTLAKREANMRTLQRKFFTALTVPMLTIVVLMAASMILHFKILPMMQSSFAEIRVAGAQLPGPTQLLVTISNFFHQNPIAYLVPIAVAAGLVVYRQNIIKSLLVQRMIVRLPVLGPAFRMMVMSRSLGALAMLEADGVPMEQCYAIAARVAKHPEYEAYFKAISQHIQKGRPTQLAYLQERWRVGNEGTDLAARMEVATTTGDVASSLQAAAALMAEEAEMRLDTLPKVIGPLVSIGAAVVVGTMAMAVMLPTFTLLMAALKMGTPK